MRSQTTKNRYRAAAHRHPHKRDLSPMILHRYPLLDPPVVIHLIRGHQQGATVNHLLQTVPVDPPPHQAVRQARIPRNLPMTVECTMKVKSCTKMTFRLFKGKSQRLEIQQSWTVSIRKVCSYRIIPCPLLLIHLIPIRPWKTHQTYCHHLEKKMKIMLQPLTKSQQAQIILKIPVDFRRDPQRDRRPFTRNPPMQMNPPIIRESPLQKIDPVIWKVPTFLLNNENPPLLRQSRCRNRRYRIRTMRV